VNIEIASKVLELMYEKWFKDFVIGFSKPELIRESGYEENQINQAIGFLESEGLTYKNNPRRYVVTTYGIDKREEKFPPATLAVKKQERRRILEVLVEAYQRDVYELMNNDTLVEKIQRTDMNYLAGTLVYLEQSGFVYLEWYIPIFFIRLAAKGFESLQDNIGDNSMFMVIAYRSLFNLENYMRKFIETKLKSVYGTDWWDKGVSQSIRDGADNRRQAEIDAGWKVSETNLVTEYLDFKDLERVIR
jgi:hypothetical protein